MQGKYTVTLIPGDGTSVQRHILLPVTHWSRVGIGPEISQSVKDIYSAAKVCNAILRTLLHALFNGYS